MVNVTSNKKHPARNLPSAAAGNAANTAQSPEKKSTPNEDAKKQELADRQRLNECLNEMTRDYPYVHSSSFDVWSNECIIDVNKSSWIEQSNPGPATIGNKPSSLSVNQVLTSQNYASLVDCDMTNNYSCNNIMDMTHTYVHSDSSVYIIDDVSNYDSPLKCFRGYRFSSHFDQFNQFEEAYSKIYCNAIDFRRPFCPFDLHGSCKDSNCIYQHMNVLTMDNFQRTEHFLSYCPQLLELSSDKPTQKEAIKKLSISFLKFS